MKVIRTKRRSERILAWVMRAIVRYGLLVLSAISVVTIYVVLRGNGITTGDVFDSRLLVGMGAAFALAALVMLLFTRAWSLRAVGQFWTYAGDAVLWGGAGAARMGWRHPFTPGELQLIRALFIVGAGGLIVGILWWLVTLAVRRWRRRGGWNGRERRIGPVERRSNWPPPTVSSG